MALTDLALLEAARAANISVTAEGDRLRIRGPRWSGDIVQQLREHEAEILALIRTPDAGCSGNAIAVQNPHYSQATNLGMCVFNSALSIDFPRVRLPDGRICKDEDRWHMFTSSTSTTQGDLKTVLADLMTLGGVVDSPGHSPEVDETPTPDNEIWSHALAVARWHMPEIVPGLESLRARGTRLFVRGDRKYFGPYDDFTDSAWTNGDDWWAEYVAALGDRRGEWERMMEDTAAPTRELSPATECASEADRRQALDVLSTPDPSDTATTYDIGVLT